jgi:hypothetical protein
VSVPQHLAAAIQTAAAANRAGVPLVDACWAAGVGVSTFHLYDRPAPLDEAVAVLELVSALRAFSGSAGTDGPTHPGVTTERRYEPSGGTHGADSGTAGKAEGGL